MNVWIDIETTGLNKDCGSILEIAIVCTDDQLHEIGEPLASLVRPLEGKGIEAMDDFVREIHTKNGLLAELYEGAPNDRCVRETLPHPHEVMERAVEHVLTIACGEAKDEPDGHKKLLKKTPLAGSSVHFDRAWLEVHMPALPALLSHRHLDVSSFNEAASRWAPKLHGKRPNLDENGKPLPAHRALDDIYASIRTARHYKTLMFEIAEKA